ncbi:S-layer homology domain-containing protein [Anoxybacterium hadale]|uniref:S-layer homology domain-containing protein n=1 Tax=Anoxybacterium hadale TaxID=3408580 RepID=A0ACD1AET6_9FIRM|nr:S-layer homology domain-containing protein [Clostridiales bacterium]
MRKVLSFVLVLTLVLGSFSMAFAATPAAISDVAGKNCEEAVRVLTSLGVVTGYEDGTYKPDQVVTRAEATLVVIKALGLANSVGTQKSSFTDLSGYGWAEGYIAFATQLGITNGYPDGSFKPGQTVSYNEFATMLVRALGYTDVSLTGTWPAKYVNQASAVGIMDDIASGGAAGANRGDVAIMANNALTAYIGSVDKDNNWSPIIKSGSVARDNIVYDTMIGRLGGNFFEGIIFDTDSSTINIRPYVGKYAEYYTSKADGKGDIMAIAAVKSTAIAGEFDDDNANNWTVAQVFEGNDDVDYKLAADMTDDTEFFYNGESTGTLSPSAITDVEVDLSGKTIKELYSASQWHVDIAEKIDAGDLDDLADGELLGFDFDTDKKDSIIDDSFELIGAKSLSDIKGDNVVYIYSGTDYIRKVAVGTEVVEGKITKINSDGDWIIAGKTYAFSDVADAASSDADAGDTVKVWLDAYGDIFDADVVSGSAKDYAVVLNTGSFDQIKLFLATDSSKVFDTDLTSAEYTAATSPANRLIGYGLDKDGAVDSVYTDDFYVAATTAEIVSNKVFDDGTRTYAIASDVVVFTKDGSDYGVTKLADVDKGTDSVGEIVSFILRENKVVAMIVNEGIAAGSGDDSYAVISKTEASTNAQDDKAYLLTGFIDGKKMSEVYTSSRSTIGEVTTGVAIYEFKYNDDKNVSKITKFTTAPVTGAVSADGKVSDGYIQLASGKKAIADNAVVYEVVFKDDNTTVKEYKAYSGTIKATYNVWMYDTDDDKAGAEVVIIEKN